MGGYNSLPALQLPDSSEGIKNALALKSAMQQQQMQSLEMQKQKQALKDQQAHTAALNQWDGKDPDQLPNLILKNGGSGDAALSMRANVLKQKQEKLSYDSQTFDLMQKKNDQMLGALKTLDSVPDEQLPQAITQKGQELIQQGLLDPQHGQMVQQIAQTGDPQKIRQALSLFEKGFMGEKEQFAQAQKERETAAKEKEAEGRRMQGEAALQKTAPLPDTQIGFLNKQLANRYQVLNPGQPLPPEYTVPQGSNRQTFEDISTSLEKLENAATARANRIQQQQNQIDIRKQAQAEKSYQFNSTQLEKVAQPVDQAIGRMGRLQDALAQGTPQADALIAPELLSVMAGGAGSGLRMNEAEIARIVGGRSKWESLQASINQWKLDPSKANSITPDQRQQIRALVTEVDNKLKAKQSALDEARQGLINSDDPSEHKRIVVNARNKMSAIDQGGTQQPNPTSGGFDWSKFPKVNQ